MSNPGIIKARRAEGDINPYRIVKHGTAERAVAQAGAATDALCGVTQDLGAVDGGVVDVCEGGHPRVEYGGTVAAGDPLTPDADAKAITATVSGSRLIGFAAVAAVAGDIEEFHFSLGFLP